MSVDFFALFTSEKDKDNNELESESSWDRRKAFQMSLSQNARMYYLSHKIYCTIGNFKIMPFQACVVSKNT